MDNYTAAMLGEGTGMLLACLPIYLIGLVAGLFLKSRDPEERAAYAAIGAWMAIYVLAGFGFARSTGTAFSFGAGLFYVPAAIIAFFMLRRHYRNLWSDVDPDLEKTFE